MSVIVWFWLSLYFFVKFNTNLINLRVVNALVGTGVGTGHWFAWLAIAAIATRWGWDNAPAGFLTVGLYSALHEGFWYVFYYAIYPGQIALTWLFYLPFGYLVLCQSISYLLLSRNRKVDERYASIPKIPTRIFLMTIALFLVTDIMWAMAGFPVTVRLDTGPTPQFPDLSTNLIEDNSWVTPALPLIFSEREN